MGQQVRLKKNVVLLGVLFVAWIDVVLDVYQIVSKSYSSWDNCFLLFPTYRCGGNKFALDECLPFELEVGTPPVTCYFKATVSPSTASLYADASCSNLTYFETQSNNEGHSSVVVPAKSFSVAGGGVCVAPGSGTSWSGTLCSDCALPDNILIKVVLEVSVSIGGTFQYILDGRLLAFLLRQWGWLAEDASVLRSCAFWLLLGFAPLINIVVVFVDVVWNKRTQFSSYDDFSWSRFRFLIIIFEDVPQLGVAAFFLSNQFDAISLAIVVFAGLRLMYGFWSRRTVIFECLFETSDDEDDSVAAKGAGAGDNGGKLAAVKMEN